MEEAIKTVPGARVRERTAEPRYRPVRDYAAIGDCHGAALVGHDGSIDWCTLRRFDADPVFCRLLDADRGGFWSIRPSGEFRAARSYLPDGNILRTVFTTAGGEVALTDFMPVGRRLDAGAHDYVSLNAPGWLVRRIEGLKGTVELIVRYRPSRAFARHPTELAVEAGAVHGEGVPSLFTDLELRADGDSASGRVTLHAGGYRDLVLADGGLPGHPPTERVSELFRITRAFWQEWLAYCRYQGPYRDAVRRSALALKLMTYAPSGALVGALTACLPEAPRGRASRDDRFCCLHAACRTLFVLAVLGYGGEAKQYYDYLARAVRRTLPRPQSRYGIEGECQPSERVLDHLEGYAGRRPVRIGNGAHGRGRIDVHGQALDLAWLYQGLGGRLGEQDRRSLAILAEVVADQWQAPDQGPWQMRGPPRQHVHGKLMSWVAIDRARRLFENGQGWAALADQIRDEIARRGVDPVRGHLEQTFDGGVDAAMLLAPMLGLPAGQETLEQTVDTVEHALGQDDFLTRHAGVDGRAGEVGCCLLCSFWLVDAKLALGRIAEARTLFERLLRCTNDVGLLAGAIDPLSGALLGNFPSAATHLALIESALNLELCGRRGAAHLTGSYADRARHAAGPIFGWRGFWARLRQCQRAGRVRSSPASRLAWP
jgi:GH15 family glucan-1,4-alpha-glucosidase